MTSYQDHIFGLADLHGGKEEADLPLIKQEAELLPLGRRRKVAGKGPEYPSGLNHRHLERTLKIVGYGRAAGAASYDYGFFHGGPSSKTRRARQQSWPSVIL